MSFFNYIKTISRTYNLDTNKNKYSYTSFSDITPRAIYECMLSNNAIIPNTDEFISNNDVDKKMTNEVPPPNVSIPKYFSSHTIQLNNKQINHDTVLLDIIAQDIGLYEITPSECEYLNNSNPNELQNTQFKIIKGYGKINQQWCAHAVSYYSKRAGINIGGYKASVQQFINWAGEDYKSIYKDIDTDKDTGVKRMTAKNYEEQRKLRVDIFKKHIEHMQEGDFIIWKTNDINNKNGSFAVKLDDGSVKIYERSHIGIIEHVDKARGIVTVIEGNANEFVSTTDAERIPVRTDAECVNGDQVKGEFQEVNKRDGLIRKEYSIYELACFGYTGFIDNSSRVPKK